MLLYDLCRGRRAGFGAPFPCMHGLNTQLQRHVEFSDGLGILPIHETRVLDMGFQAFIFRCLV